MAQIEQKQTTRTAQKCLLQPQGPEKSVSICQIADGSFDNFYHSLGIGSQIHNFF